MKKCVLGTILKMMGLKNHDPGRISLINWVYFRGNNDAGSICWDFGDPMTPAPSHPFKFETFCILVALELPLLFIAFPFQGDGNLFIGAMLVWQFFILGLLFAIKGVCEEELRTPSEAPR